MPWDALPEHIDEPHEWKGTDHDNWAQRWILKYKGWLAYGPRSKHKWAAWKSPPQVVIAKGVTRWESLTSPDAYQKDFPGGDYFPSVVQYWSRYHFLVTRSPSSIFSTHLSFHFFWPWAKPTKFPERKDFSIYQMFSFRIGARYDKDDVYWFPSAAIGGDFV